VNRNHTGPTNIREVTNTLTVRTLEDAAMPEHSMTPCLPTVERSLPKGRNLTHSPRDAIPPAMFPSEVRVEIWELDELENHLHSLQFSTRHDRPPRLDGSPVFALDFNGQKMKRILQIPRMLNGGTQEWFLVLVLFIRLLYHHSPRP
jgi:hypothetical protein